MNQFEELLLIYPTASWDWRLVSSNPSVSFQFILDHPELPWISKFVSFNPNIIEKDVYNHIEYPWDYEGLCMNPNLSLAFFNEYIIKPDVVHRIDWHLLSSNPSITMIDIIHHPTYNWDDRYLSANPNITSNFILNEGFNRKWFVPSVSSNSGITRRDIFKSTLKSVFDWDYKNLSANKNLPIAYVNDNKDKDWNYHSISMNASINDINKFHQIKWDDHGLSLNQNITFEFIHSHPNVNWDYRSIIMNPLISLDIILNDYDYFISKWNDTTPLESYMSSNPTITNDWIKRNLRFIDWKRLSSNQLIRKSN